MTNNTNTTNKQELIMLRVKGIGTKRVKEVMAILKSEE